MVDILFTLNDSKFHDEKVNGYWCYLSPIMTAVLRYSAGGGVGGGRQRQSLPRYNPKVTTIVGR